MSVIKSGVRLDSRRLLVLQAAAAGVIVLSINLAAPAQLLHPDLLYTFDQGTYNSTTLFDQSGHGYHATAMQTSTAR